MPQQFLFIDPKCSLAVSVTKAIHTGDLTTLRSLVEAHPDLITSYIGSPSEARSLLHILTDHPGTFPNASLTAQILLAAGADPNISFIGKAHSETPLHWAASCDNVPVLDILLDAGADINAKGGVIAETPLADARAFLQLNAARRLVERGAEVTLQDAATLGLLGLVKAFFEGGRPSRPSVHDTDLALWNACHGGQLEVVRYLHEQGAELNIVPPWEDLRPLDAATRSNANNVAQWLRENGGTSIKTQQE